MASRYQQKVRLRKLLYAVLILFLFTGSLLFRKNVVEAQAYNLQLRETSRGEVSLAGAAVRSMLIGSRGIAVTVLWSYALDKQEKHEWNEVELVVNSITTLQPYFTTPWLFQSWNLAFNVSVECDKPRDKYYFVSRGIRLLARGERVNQGTAVESEDNSRVKFPGNPDMRHYIGFYYQLKMGSSDEKNTMQCLLDLSNIDPLERDPKLARLWEVPGSKVDIKRFEQFTRKYPRLVRRLTEKLDYIDTPLDVVAFLENSKDVPSRFTESMTGEASERLQAPRDQFPILPPYNASDESENWPSPNDPKMTSRESVDVYLICRTWYQYAQKPLPPPHKELGIKEPEYNPTIHRIPRYMAISIFRGYPARAQAYIAEQLEKEGWFDEGGWQPPSTWFGESSEPFGTSGKLLMAQPAWKKAYDMYYRHGEENGLLILPTERKQLEEKAAAYREARGISAMSRAPDTAALRDESLREGRLAHERLFWNAHYRRMTNYDAQLATAKAESTAEAVLARKLFYRANQLRGNFNLGALRYYEKAIPVWTSVLMRHPLFRENGTTTEDSYENQLRYLKAKRDDKPAAARAQYRQIVAGMNQFAIWPHAFTRTEAMLNWPALVGTQLQHGTPVGIAEAALRHSACIGLGASESRPLSVYDMLTFEQKSEKVPNYMFLGPFEMLHFYRFGDPAVDQDAKMALNAIAQGAVQPPLMTAVRICNRNTQDFAFATWSLSSKHRSWRPIVDERTVSNVLSRRGFKR